MEAKGGEVRRVHVVYFLSRMGRIEHPHLIRVHHLNRTGVHLRDVKRWLSDLRGKDMPDSFAWSYKRRYKTGYVWQDLLDDDLITPIADNEYVLKGSEISPFPFDSCACAEKTTVIPKPDPVEDQTQQQQPEKIPELKIDVSCKTTETNIWTDGSFRRMMEFNLEEEDDDDKKGEERVIEEEPKEGVLDAGLEDEKTEEESKRSFGASFTKSKSHSGGASHVLRNLLSCRTVETNDSATLPINRRRKTTSNCDTPQPNKGEIRKAERLSGSHRILSGAWNNQPQHNGRKSTSAAKCSNNTSELGNQKMASSAFKPVAEPNCSQCGKAFKPERLHAHMKSCKGLKTRSKGNAAEKLSQTTLEAELTTKEANPGFLLTR